MILPKDVLVLVADGGRMMLLRNDGDAVKPKLAVIEHRDSPAPANRDLFADAPGRAFESHSPARSAYDNRDPHAEHERAFLASASAALESHVTKDTPGIIIAADPVSLGQLRQHYPQDIAKLLLTEFDKDLTAMTVDDITAYLVDAEFPTAG